MNRRDAAVWADGTTALAAVMLVNELRRTLAIIVRGLEHGQDIDQALGLSTAVVVREADVVELVNATMELEAAERRLRAEVDQLPLAEIEVRAPLSRAAAEAELAAGVEDLGRVEALASCLPASVGFGVLSAASRCTEAHKRWGHATLEDVLSRFRDSDRVLIASVTEAAGVSPHKRWADCDREQTAAIAAALAVHDRREREVSR
jgi:hypothetical protein